MRLPAFGFRRIIEQMSGEGKDGGVVVCPLCGGGSRQRRTLSVNRRDGVWLWVCHRATCNARGAMAADPREILGRSKPSRFEPREFTHPVRLPQPGDEIWDRVWGLVPKNGCDQFALDWGLRTLLKNPEIYAWECYDLKRQLIGWQARAPHKVITSYREHDGPFYAAFLPDGTETNNTALLIVEDPLSAALMADEGVPTVALLGTNMSDDLADDVRNWSLRFDKRVVVAMDPDAAGLTAQRRVIEALRSMGGHPIPWRLEKDVNKSSPHERRHLAQVLKEYES